MASFDTISPKTLSLNIVNVLTIWPLYTNCTLIILLSLPVNIWNFKFNPLERVSRIQLHFWEVSWQLGPHFLRNNMNKCKIRNILLGKLLHKICRTFWDTTWQSWAWKRYEQIFPECSLGCRNALNFICLLMKFHNHGNTSVAL